MDGLRMNFEYEMLSSFLGHFIFMWHLALVVVSLLEQLKNNRDFRVWDIGRCLVNNNPCQLAIGMNNNKWDWGEKKMASVIQSNESMMKSQVCLFPLFFFP